MIATALTDLAITIVYGLWGAGWMLQATVRDARRQLAGTW
jgi:hypothetical protein